MAVDRARGGPERVFVRAPTDTRITRDRILDNLRSKPEWGIDLGVFEEIMKWGSFVLIKHEGEIVGFRLRMERCREDVSTTIEYFHPAQVNINWKHQGISKSTKLQNVRNVRLQEEWRHRGKEIALYLEGEIGKDNPWRFSFFWGGFIEKSKMSLLE